jgi:hypothetical protein
MAWVSTAVSEAPLDAFADIVRVCASSLAAPTDSTLSASILGHYWYPSSAIGDIEELGTGSIIIISSATSSVDTAGTVKSLAWLNSAGEIVYYTTVDDLAVLEDDVLYFPEVRMAVTLTI